MLSKINLNNFRIMGKKEMGKMTGPTPPFVQYIKKYIAGDHVYGRSAVMKLVIALQRGEACAYTPSPFPWRDAILSVVSRYRKKYSHSFWK